MTDKFTWVPEVERGDWLKAMETEQFASLLSIVPAGYEAYARVFHPVQRHRPRGERTWAQFDAQAYVGRDPDGPEELETEATTWAHAAASFGTTMHAAAQFSRLVRTDRRDYSDRIAPDGWRYDVPEEGCLETPALAALSTVLAKHTTTPHDGIAAIWEGWGGLVSAAGRASFTFTAVLADEGEQPNQASKTADSLVAEPSLPVAFDPWPEDPELSAMLSMHLETDQDEPEPGTGTLPREIAVGPRFGLHEDTGRSYILFEVGATDLADPAWPKRAPWIDDDQFCVSSPSILWPNDRSWVLATEIDYDSTLIAGSAALIQELLQTPGLEVLPIDPHADLSWTGDTINEAQRR